MDRARENPRPPYVKEHFRYNLQQRSPHSVGESSRISSGVIVLSKGNLGCWIARALAGMLFLGAAVPGCVTVPKPTETKEVSVTFVFVGRHDSVCLSGDFNGWSSESDCLKREGDRWSVQLVLPPGTYRYGFVIDKRDWVCDPEALIQEDDGFGRKNSVLVIDQAVTKMPPAP